MPTPKPWSPKPWSIADLPRVGSIWEIPLYGGPLDAQSPAEVMVTAISEGVVICGDGSTWDAMRGEWPPPDAKEISVPKGD